MQYIVSDRWDYEGYLCDDAGPAFAADYNWQVRNVTRDALGSGPQIIDPLLHPDERRLILAEIKSRPGSLYLVRITDPYWTPLDLDIHSFFREAIRLPNVVLMLTYTPNEHTAYYLSVASNRKFVFAPYVYRAENELPITEERFQKVLLSGRMNRSIYPLRCNFRRASRLWPPLTMRTAYLPHPGYGNNARTLPFTRGGYVKKLSEYKFAFACSARTRSEFLKYREIAYAGAVPVGDMPASFSECPSHCHVKYMGGVRSIASALANARETSEMAADYRRFVSAERNQQKMIAYVDEQVASL